MNQIEQQLRLTIEALRERQEHELVNSPDFGLLHNADVNQRIHARIGPPTPDDLDAAPPPTQVAVLPRPSARHRSVPSGM